mmetsp:Transcript_5377/g.6233  ORF Transcript_5377/g.6233 Transcript_5377/m.6233 type:complete len:111 (-) Transcript_5377:70-402(-)
MFLRLLCLGIALCGALDAGCDSEITSLIQDQKSHGQLQSEEQNEKKEEKEKEKEKGLSLDSITSRMQSLLQLGTWSGYKSNEVKANATASSARLEKAAMADWIARDLKSF